MSDGYKNINAVEATHELHPAGTVAALQARIAKLEAAQGWRPGDTAPRTGDPFLVYNSKRNQFFIVCWVYDDNIRYGCFRRGPLVGEPGKEYDPYYDVWTPIPSLPSSGAYRKAGLTVPPTQEPTDEIV